MTPRRLFWPTLATVLILVLLGVAWALGAYDGVGFAGGTGLMFGIAVALALGFGLMAVVVYGRRSRRDEAVRRQARDDG